MAKSRKRRTVSADDVFAALDEIELGNLIPACRDVVAKRMSAIKSRPKQPRKSKKKAEDTAEGEGEEEEEAANEDGDDMEQDEEVPEEPTVDFEATRIDGVAVSSQPAYETDSPKL
eukprot:Clim_evm3s180 gene=Clim_evmTU3s180